MENRAGDLAVEEVGGHWELLLPRMILHLDAQVVVLVNLGQRKCLVEHGYFLDDILHEITIGIIYSYVRNLTNDFQ